MELFRLNKNQTVSGSNVFSGANTFSGATTFTGAQTSSEKLLNTKNKGTKAAVSTVVAEESGDGVHHVTKLTLTNYVIGPLAGAAAAKVLVPPQALYTFPAGAHILLASYLSLALTAAGTAKTPDVGLGSVAGDGSANATLDLSAAGSEDIHTGYTAGSTSTHAVGASGPKGATAGMLTGIALNGASGVKTVFLNAAASWAADNTGNLTVTGTVVLVWDTLV
jgi:hypothetical protein